jgi:hypothetical protein
MNWFRKAWLSLALTFGGKKAWEKATKQERRWFIRRRVESFFVPKNEGTDVKTHLSPSLRYSLRVTSYQTSKGCWNYTRGEVFDTSVGTGVKVSDVKRNYSHFPFAWVEGHPDGHDYLVCGEDYQGQTIIQLDTGKRVDSDDNEWGFCWTDIEPSPDKTVLAVVGCFWGGSYEVVLFDFSNPLSLPHPEIDRANNSDYDGAMWNADGTILLKKEIEVRPSDKKPYSELTEEEQEEIDEADSHEYVDVTEQWDSAAFEAFRKKTR